MVRYGMGFIKDEENNMATKAKAAAISEPTNGGKEAIETGLPYTAHITIVGSADLLLHAWNVEAVDEKAKAKKGSDAKKTDNVESYVRRNEDGIICLPAEYLRMSVVNAAKFRQDPRCYCGNSVMWWAVDGQGYTSNLEKAWKVPATWKGRDTDKLWLCSDIDAGATRQFDMQSLRNIKPLTKSASME